MYRSIQSFRSRLHLDSLVWAIFALIATPSILLIGIPVVFASPDGWSNNKNVLFSGTSL